MDSQTKKGNPIDLSSTPTLSNLCPPSSSKHDHLVLPSAVTSRYVFVRREGKDEGKKMKKEGFCFIIYIVNILDGFLKFVTNALAKILENK